jgi:hypothetical protein
LKSKAVKVYCIKFLYDSMYIRKVSIVFYSTFTASVGP